MPQIAANYIFNSEQPNFARDQVQTYEELETYGNSEGKTSIDVGHITFVVEENKHYTYVELTDEEGHRSGTYGWVEFKGASGSGSGGDSGGTTPTTGALSYFKSLVFKRAQEQPTTPSGGSFLDPYPSDTSWQDGIPDGIDPIWMSTRVFSTNSEYASSWTEPQLISDSDVMDYEFSSVEENPGVPQKTDPFDTTDYNDGWSNVAGEGTIWMAMRHVYYGQYSESENWEVVRIKGESGTEATIIYIRGSVNTRADLEALSPESLNTYDAYVVLNTSGSDTDDNIFVWDGDSWENCGRFKGTFDPSKNWAYLHIKYSDDGQTFTEFKGEVPGKWVGTYCDYTISDSDVFSDYYWKQVSGQDGFGYSYIYYLNNDENLAPDVPTDHTNDDNDPWESINFAPNNWYDEFPGVDRDHRCCWRCYRLRVDGQWTEFLSFDGKTGRQGGKASLYAHYAIDGTAASAASRSFMIFTKLGVKDPDAENLELVVPQAPANNSARWDVSLNTLVPIGDGNLTSSTDVQNITATWDVDPGNSIISSENPADNRYIWMSVASFSEDNDGAMISPWSTPQCITGHDGVNGTDGETKSYAYYICSSETEASRAIQVAPGLSNRQNADSLETDPTLVSDYHHQWLDHPTGISEENPIELCSIAARDSLGDWYYGAPFIWSKWGEDGIDGDGVEYLYFIASEDEVETDQEGKVHLKASDAYLYKLPTTEQELRTYLTNEGFSGDALENAVHDFYYSNSEWMPLNNGEGWTDDPKDVGPGEPYEFVSVRKFNWDGEAEEKRWGFWSEPTLWAKWAEGRPGYTVFTSIVFCRASLGTNMASATLSGGTVNDPKPSSTILNGNELQVVNIDTSLWTGWQDSVPSGPASWPIWMASKVFGSDSNDLPWRGPIQMTDAPGFQVEYTASEHWVMVDEEGHSTLPNLNDFIDPDPLNKEGINEVAWRAAARTSTGVVWGDIDDLEETEDDIVNPWWMITSQKDSNGWSTWAIHKIRGEKGETGTSISIKGNFTTYRNLGDPTIDSAIDPETGETYGQVDHDTSHQDCVKNGDCYVINGLLWIYDGNATEVAVGSGGTYSTSGISDVTDLRQNDKYAGFTCQGQFKGDPGEPGQNSWLHVKFANKAVDQTPGGEDTASRVYYSPNGVYIELTSGNGSIPGKYSGIGIFHGENNTGSNDMRQYTWSEWKGDDLYGTEQIFILAGTTKPECPTWNNWQNYTDEQGRTIGNIMTQDEWYTYDAIPPKVKIPGSSDSYWEWMDTPSDPTPNSHCYVCTRRLTDVDDKEWKGPFLYTRYAEDGADGIDGDVNEFIYHLGPRNAESSLTSSFDSTKAKDWNTNDIQTDRTSTWWISDDSRDYCPSDGTQDGFWTDNPRGVSYLPNEQVEYYRYRTREFREVNLNGENEYYWTDWSPVMVWSSWGEKGNDGDGVEYIFTLTDDDENTTEPANPTPDWENLGLVTEEAKNGYEDPINGKKWGESDFVPSGWTDDPQKVTADSSKRVQYVSIRRSSHYGSNQVAWSDFSDPTPWNWYVEDGKDGDSVEFIYLLAAGDVRVGLDLEHVRLSDGTYKTLTLEELENNSWWASGNSKDCQPKATIDGTAVNYYWTDNPQGVADASNKKIEYYCIRYRRDEVWGSWEGPFQWSRWAENGRDGDGVEYIFKLTSDINTSPGTPSKEQKADNSPGNTWADDDFIPEGWTDDPQQPTPTMRAEWVSIRKSHLGVWDSSVNWSTPVVWNEYNDKITEQRFYHFGTGNKYMNQPTIPSDWRSPYYTGTNDAYQSDNWTPVDSNNGNWSTSPLSISAEQRTEWYIIRWKDLITGKWSAIDGPHAHTAWGLDGNGIEFVFWLITETEKNLIESAPDGITPISDSYEISGRTYTKEDDEYLPTINVGGDHTAYRATDEADGMTMSAEKPYLYASKRTKVSGVWGEFGKIFIFNQFNVSPEFAYSLELSRDTDTVAVQAADNSSYRSWEKNVGSKNPVLLTLYYGSTTVNSINKITVIPINRTNGNLSQGDESANIIKTAGGEFTTISINSKNLGVKCYSADSGYYCLEWKSISNYLEFTEYNSAPVDLSFIIRAYTSDNKVGQSMFTIHPVDGTVIYEFGNFQPREIFKIVDENTSAITYDPSFVECPIFKTLYSESATKTEGPAVSEDWESLAIKCYVDDNLKFTTSTSTSDTAWEVSERDGKLMFKITPSSIDESGIDIQSSIRLELYKRTGDSIDSNYDDNEVIGVNYTDKEVIIPNYYKTERAYYLTNTEDGYSNSSYPEGRISSLPDSGHDLWIKSIVNPSASYRYLYAVERTNEHWGDTRDNHSGGDVKAYGPWSAPWLFASRLQGPQGDSGLAGAVVRGPVKWENAVSNRLWNSGDTEEENGIKYIDIVVHNDHYYRCKTTHNHTGSTDVPGSSDYWTLANGKYEFIATDLLLATNAKIKFLSGNQLVLTYDNNGTETISGGAVGGTGVNFWSGGTSHDDPNNKFTVDYQGNLTSTAGNIAGWEIGPNSLSASGYRFSSTGEGKDSPRLRLSYTLRYSSNNTDLRDDSDTSLYNDGLNISTTTTTVTTGGTLYYKNTLINGNWLEINSTNNSSSVKYSSILTDDSLYLKTDRLNTTGHSSSNISNLTLSSTGIHASHTEGGSFDLYLGEDPRLFITASTHVSGPLYISSDEKDVTISSGSITADGDIKSTNGNLFAGDYASTLSFGRIPFKIAIVINPSDSSSLFTTSSDGYWYFNGTSTGISSTDYPTLSYNDTKGYYFTKSSGDAIYTGVVPNTVTRRGDTIYIEI